MAKNLRNAAIVAGIAALVVIVPGGGRGQGVATQIVSVAFLAAVGWVMMLLYREHRNGLYSLGDRRRGILYGAAGVATLTLTATSRLWQTLGGRLAWFILLGAVILAGISVFRAARPY